MKRFPLYLSFLLLLSCAKDSTEDKSSLYVTPPSGTTNITPLLTQYTLTVIAGEGGSVSSEGGEYGEGTEVIITATPDQGYEFAGWSDGSTNQQITIVINSNTSFSAIFNKVKFSLNSYENQRSGIRWGWGDQASNPITRPNWQCCQKPEYWNNGQVYEDINNDGYQDILLSAAWDSENNVTVDWWINNGQNEFELDSTYIIESTKGTRAHKILETDVNNDNIKDFIILGVDERIPGDYDGNFTVLIREGEYFRVNRVNENNGLWFHNGAAGDLNGDGNVDVVAAQWIWWGDGNGNFTKSNIDTDQWIDSPLVYEIIDYNKDGFNDLIMATHYRHDSTTIIYGSENWSSPTVEKLDQLSEVYTNIMDIEIYDLDGDEILDIIELRNSEETENKPANSANSMLLSSTNINLDQSKDGYKLNGENDTFGWSIFKIDDIDDDGVDDIVSENYHDGNYNGLKLVGNVWTKWLFK